MIPTGRAPAHATLRDRLAYRADRAEIRIECTSARIRIDLERDAAPRTLDSQHRRIAARPLNRIALHNRIVLAIRSTSSSRRSDYPATPAALSAGTSPVTLRARLGEGSGSCTDFGATAGRSYIGASVASAPTGISATTCPCHRIRHRRSSVIRPITTACRSHFSNTACSSASRPRSATISIRSCDSESRISYGVSPSSRSGTKSRSSSIPSPPRSAISLDDDVSPAAPMSWIATIAPVCRLRGTPRSAASP